MSWRDERRSADAVPAQARIADLSNNSTFSNTMNDGGNTAGSLFIVFSPRTL